MGRITYIIFLKIIHNNLKTGDWFKLLIHSCYAFVGNSKNNSAKFNESNIFQKFGHVLNLLRILNHCI